MNNYRSLFLKRNKNYSQKSKHLLSYELYETPVNERCELGGGVLGSSLIVNNIIAALT